MPKVWSRIKQQQGFSVVEALLAAAIFGLLVTVLIGAVIYGRASSANAGDHNRATFLAEEGIEATRNIAAASYANLVNGTYGLTQSANQWALSGTSDISGIYTRQVVVASAGTNRKSVTSTVTWPQFGGGATTSVTLTTQLANWKATTPLWTNGIQAGATDVAGSTANAIKADTIGNYSYTVLSAATSNFVITNVATPATPTNTATLSIGATPTNIFVSGNYAYVTTTSDTSELIVVDITNPTIPAVVGSYNAAGTADGLGVHVIGTIAYVSRAANAGAAEFVIVDVAAPASPTLVGSYGQNVAMNEVYVSGNYAYIATNNTAQELLVINITNPAAPTLTIGSNLATVLNAPTITGYGNTLLVGSGTILYAINVTTPAAPAQLGTFTAAGAINDIDVDGTNNFAFLGTAATAAEFQVVNIAAPASMTLAKSVDATGTLSTLGGVGYNLSSGLVIGASASDTQEIMVFTRN